METIDWVIQGIAGALCVWLLADWWREDDRIAAMAKILVVVVTVVGVTFQIIYYAYGAGVRAQYKADETAVVSEWEARNKLISDLNDALIENRVDGSSAFSVAGKIIQSRAKIDTVSDSIMSLRSVLFLLALWTVTSFVARVPAPASRNRAAQRETNGKSNQDE